MSDREQEDERLDQEAVDPPDPQPGGIMSMDGTEGDAAVDPPEPEPGSNQ